MSRWFRHYAGMMRDDKLVRVALKSGQTVERVCWVYGAILESAAEMNDDGRYDFDVDEAAYFLRADAADVAAIVSCLESCGRLDGGFVVRWTERQFKSDTSAERVRRHREKKKMDGNGDENERLEKPKRHGNADVTLQQRFGNGPETETETETDKIIEPDGSMSPQDGDTPSESLISPSESVSRETIHACFTAFQAMAGQIGIPVPERETAKRRKAIGARLREFGDESWDRVLSKIRGSPFLRGETGRDSWNGCDLDWLTRPNNYPKVLEGKYDPANKNHTGGTGGQPSRYERFLRRHSVSSADDEGERRTSGGNLRIIEGGC